MERLTDEQLTEIRKRAELFKKHGPGSYFDSVLRFHACKDVPKLLAEIERLNAELQGERNAKTEIVEELFGKRIREGAVRIADELRRRLGDSHD